MNKENPYKHGDWRRPLFTAWTQDALEVNVAFDSHYMNWVTLSGSDTGPNFDSPPEAYRTKSGWVSTEPQQTPTLAERVDRLEMAMAARGHFADGEAKQRERAEKAEADVKRLGVMLNYGTNMCSYDGGCEGAGIYSPPDGIVCCSECNRPRSKTWHALVKANSERITLLKRATDAEAERNAVAGRLFKIEQIIGNKTP